MGWAEPLVLIVLLSAPPLPAMPRQLHDNQNVFSCGLFFPPVFFYKRRSQHGNILLSPVSVSFLSVLLMPMETLPLSQTANCSQQQNTLAFFFFLMEYIKIMSTFFFFFSPSSILKSSRCHGYWEGRFQHKALF